MSRRKKLSTDFASGVLVRGDKEPSDIDKTAVVHLGDGWKPAVLKLLPNSSLWAEIRRWVEIHFDGGELSRFEIAIETYVLHRMARVQPITWEAQLNRLKSMSAAVEVLAQELNSPNWQIRSTLWQRITNEFPADGRDELVRRVREALVALSVAVAAAYSLAIREEAAGEGISYDGPFFALVGQLKEIAERYGIEATASKQTMTRKGDPAPISPFVELVWTIMTKAVPNHFREHTASKGAMAKAVSSVLTTIRMRQHAT